MSAAHHALLTSPVSWTYHHIKGHQDDDPNATLDQWVLLNIQMDSLAKAYWMETLHQPTSCNMVFENEIWPIFHRNQKVHSSLCHTHYESIYKDKIETHWNTNERLTPDLSRQINWDACRDAMHHLKISRCIWVVKHMEGMCRVGKWMLHWGERDTDTCPHCPAVEDARHVWQCPANGPKAIRMSGIDHLDTWMDSETM